MNTCDDKTSKSGTRIGRGRKSGRGSGKARPGSTARAVALLASCDGPDAPAVSTECGVNSTVVRLWSSGPAGAGAPWNGIAWIADCGCCDDDCCICC